MKDANQPQTTNNHNDRDAAAQISVESGYEKADAIREGALMNARSNFPEDNLYQNAYNAAYKLAIVLQDLTSANKADRERAKASVREPVQLGKKATK